MIRIVLGMLIMMGAVGHDEYMMEIGEIVPMSGTLMKAALGVALMWWGV